MPRIKNATKKTQQNKEAQKQLRSQSQKPGLSLADEYRYLVDETESEGNTQNVQPKRSLSQKPKSAQNQVQSREQLKANFHETARQKADRRFRPGQKALRDIKKYQQSSGNLMRRLPFQRMVKRITDKVVHDKLAYDRSHQGNLMYRRNALEYLQRLSEDYLTSFFEDCNLCCFHARRVTVLERDVLLARRIRGIQDPAYFDTAIDFTEFFTRNI